jgi:hypothetical protein
MAEMAVSPRPRASIVSAPGETRVSGAGCGSKIQGARPLDDGVGVPGVALRAGVVTAEVVGAGVVAAEVVGAAADETGAVAAGVVAGEVVGPDVAPGVAAGAGAVSAAVGVATTAESGAGVGRPFETEDVTPPRALNSAPTADQARLPSSKMPTMPTIVAISRAGEPSSGRVGRSTSFQPTA